MEDFWLGFAMFLTGFIVGFFVLSMAISAAKAEEEEKKNAE